jgi:hypothetical protein
MRPKHPQPGQADLFGCYLEHEQLFSLLCKIEALPEFFEALDAMKRYGWTETQACAERHFHDHFPFDYQPLKQLCMEREGDIPAVYAQYLVECAAHRRDSTAFGPWNEAVLDAPGVSPDHLRALLDQAMFYGTAIIANGMEDLDDLWFWLDVGIRKAIPRPVDRLAWFIERFCAEVREVIVHEHMEQLTEYIVGWLNDAGEATRQAVDLLEGCRERWRHLLDGEAMHLALNEARRRCGLPWVEDEDEDV